ncbi:hypothetical protein [Lactiplantibacillus plantarum]|uniref:hypothetical protein n=1 Tax=Lactiplantibacillus plantarum TaxID=1590 RepID=UPI003F746ABD
MQIHTLGPTATDSYAAAQVYNHRNWQDQAVIVKHPSFETILTDLTAYSGDQLVIPAAFKSDTLNASWGDTLRIIVPINVEQLFYDPARSTCRAPTSKCR